MAAVPQFQPASTLGRRCRRALVLAALLLAPGILCAQAQPETVGAIEGEDISVAGSIRVEFENGRNTTVLASGSSVTVRSGDARLALAEGGVIGICGPARFSVLKSGGAITLALDYGRVRVVLNPAVPLTIYTPLIVATPVAIGAGPRDATLGLDLSGGLCVRAAAGALRIEQQLTGQSLLVPQSGEISLVGGQLDSARGSAGTCNCEILAARATPPPPLKPPELSALAAARPPEAPKTPTEKTPEPARNPEVARNEVPIYKVFMPPLSFNATSPEPPPDPSPATILLVREVRVSPGVVFRGTVTPAPELPPVEQQAALAEVSPPKQEGAGVIARVKEFFQRLWRRAPCAGVGCGNGGK